jgi:hypothetical protein
LVVSNANLLTASTTARSSEAIQTPLPTLLDQTMTLVSRRRASDKSLRDLLGRHPTLAKMPPIPAADSLCGAVPDCPRQLLGSTRAPPTTPLRICPKMSPPTAEPTCNTCLR